ncbi:MAG: DUF86 domain-containing protein [Syntrophomonadaceae bacterium]|nr:DUF86 domain-containing protein [Syntrophomonadaceae bacterium]MDD3889898.1 DUF86 domain-containing protein [Syntrophomonadaceae bacterium]MDD4548966.1 DUF86 domain-containing protein [Syntrophomonadaceae bacterium]
MKNDLLYLEHILESILRIEQYTVSGKDTFMNSQITQDAVIRNLEIIGEATKNVSRQYRQEHPQVPWKQMAAMRDVLIHDYMGVDLKIVWNVVNRELSQIKDTLKRILE